MEQQTATQEDLMKELVNGLTIPSVDGTKKSWSRRDRRLIEKLEVEKQLQTLKDLKKNVEANTKLVTNLINIYTKSYDDYILQNPNNDKKVLGIKFPFNINATSVKLEELVANTISDPNAWVKAMDLANPGHVKVMYLRVDIKITFDETADIKPRSGVPEQLIDNYDKTKTLDQLFYHAVVPLEDDQEFTIVTAKDRLLNDLITHLFCLGIDFQQANNNRSWMNKLESQTRSIQDKVNEITDMFSHIGNEESK